MGEVTKGHYFEKVYVHNNIEYSQAKVNTNKDLQKVFSNPDKNKYMNFHLRVAETVGDSGYAKIEIHPDNVFRAFDKQGKLIQISK